MAKKDSEIEVSVAEVVDYMRITGGFEGALREVVERKITAEAAKEKGVKISTQELQKAADGLRLINGLTTAKATEAWLRSKGISLEAFENHVETSLLASKFKDELEKKADKARYLGSQEVKDTVRHLIYMEWLKTKLK
jgi:hypothetical protein